MPGLSSTPITEILASSRLNAMPEMIACSMCLVFLERDERALRRRLGILERRQHAQLDLVLAGELDRADLQHLRAEARHLEHFLERDRVEPARFAARCAGRSCRRRRRRCRSGTRRRVSAAASATPDVSEPPRPERRDVAVGVHALEAGDDDDRAGREIARACSPRRSRGCAPWCTRCRSACAPGRRCSSAP